MDDRRLLDTGDFDEEEAIERIAAEFREGFAQLAKIDRPAVTMFGSARIPEGHPSYDATRAIATRFAERGWAVITGCGPGLMDAGNRLVVYPMCRAECEPWHSVQPARRITRPSALSPMAIQPVRVRCRTLWQSRSEWQLSIRL